MRIDYAEDTRVVEGVRDINILEGYFALWGAK